MDGHPSTGEADYLGGVTGRRSALQDALSRGLTFANGAGHSGSELELN